MYTNLNEKNVNVSNHLRDTDIEERTVRSGKHLALNWAENVILREQDSSSLETQFSESN
jgi:hypothetical protein